MFHLLILNLQQTIFEGDVKSLTIPAKQGQLTILPNHLPIITPLKNGSISAVIPSALSQKGVDRIEHSEESERKYFECSGGILEFTDNRAVILL
ncbi:MAG: hypothetical protein A3B96_00850 [Candidatus Spechtbacteria bacterium RIFCSPHIGHO2_02_FULL_43_15b]|uniref:ATP synthase F1 complex delta/epsilon subunit N-terminal domain-containing protein n=1 Tax=Candidatus Spechtbacteria bacterium RIFCSPHIGHO2_01_FULL_43_30 TaxID=1802158 RepID=A0A1G2H4L2_9BACT|nr:MAG: hypothetical protein A2827_00985 [Candidatus Spechtbacteria bacterium RIFCSPHIGHO2_01_FULL_43_30]OGZ59849.1 MAG: hypothetical protein A3B96_00850 [Candidatus Spechtbacteria bacterium RIFCSPHIGHO2_02_FULL_43_15b]